MASRVPRWFWLVLGGGVLFILGGAAVAGWTFYSMIRSSQDGIAYGKGRGAPECVDEGIHRAHARWFGSMAEGSFTMTCLSVAKMPEGYCDVVPAADPLAFDWSEWHRTHCPLWATRNECRYPLQMLQLRCHPPEHPLQQR